MRAKEAGYDGMELHAAHAYMLLGSFLSPLRNGRRDEYGGKSLRVRAINEKAREGRAEDIRRCISCENCIDSMVDYQNLDCAVNAATGREETYVITPAEKRKRVVIVGADLAAIELAEFLSKRGRKAHVLEAAKRVALDWP